MNCTIDPVGAENVSEFLNFFDNRAFCDNPTGRAATAFLTTSQAAKPRGWRVPPRRTVPKPKR